jgi:alkylhydroperoxidase family enzyme
MTQRLPGTADDVRARVPGVIDSYREIRDNVLLSGIVDRALKELCSRYLAGDPEARDRERYSGRERAALDWTEAIVYDSALADDALWARLHADFSEPELVELGCAIGFELGFQHWRGTLGLPPRDRS